MTTKKYVKLPISYVRFMYHLNEWLCLILPWKLFNKIGYNVVQKSKSKS